MFAGNVHVVIQLYLDGKSTIDSPVGNNHRRMGGVKNMTIFTMVVDPWTVIVQNMKTI